MLIPDERDEDGDGNRSLCRVKLALVKIPRLVTRRWTRNRYPREIAGKAKTDGWSRAERQNSRKVFSMILHFGIKFKSQPSAFSDFSYSSSMLSSAAPTSEGKRKWIQSAPIP
ncbi:hypothetical protein OUZ56_014043 [Daphnia magna]|uniref:Uncharacterized protein n=1 Tax=Daphnia magna TaxID=35525 RepID=A0ABQ9Z7S0_9CRUS|nr:hypothetical protein OUZ56_014043 [Daphnia magna]